MDPVLFIRRNTVVAAPPLVPEIRLHLATEVTSIWQASEDALQRHGVPPPFWAFAWAGGQALARYLLDHPGSCAGKPVFDFGAGSGLVAIAANLAGAAHTVAADVDSFACAAIGMNAALNGVAIEVAAGDPVEASFPAAALVTAGDICYEQPMAGRAIGWLRGLAGRGTRVLIGDPGRAYLPKAGLHELARYRVPTSPELEDREVLEALVFELLPG